jgi:threonyl-tRNA synthetase
MRLLMLHSDYFRYECVQKTPISEEVDEGRRRGHVEGSVLVVFISSEKRDAENPSEVAKKAVGEILDIAGRVKALNIVLHSFAHLSDELSPPDVAKAVIDEMERMLASNGGNRVLKTPFGWRDTFELRVKGHPISKVSRKIAAE